MNIPTVNEPERLRGLYMYDFGEWTAVGYTAEEIAILLESETYGDGKVYKIHNVSPDGRFELRGVSAERFKAESGVFFYRDDLDAAREDFDTLVAAVEKTPPPCRAFLHLADRGDVGRTRYVTALIYPAEYEDEIGRWLVKLDYAGGDIAEGGPSHVSNYYSEEKTLLERRQLWTSTATQSRTPDEVLSNVRTAVQR